MARPKVTRGRCGTTARLGAWFLVAAVTAAAAAGAEEPAADPQVEKVFEREVTITARLRYLLALPEGYGDDERRWPLLVFLHGAGESGDDLAKVKAHGPPRLLAAGARRFPCIVVSPQSPGRGWNNDHLLALVDEICRDHRVDEDRIWLTGLSMGGFGTWSLAAARPDRFAAIVPICGGGRPDDAARIASIPTWAFHGAKDFVVPLAASQTMIDAVRKQGGEPKFTVYPDAGHDSWTAAYDDAALWEWLFAQSRAGRGQAAAE